MRHGPRRFPRALARHARRGEGGKARGAGLGSRPSGAGGRPARRSHIREGGSPFPGVFQDPSGPGNGEGRRQLQPSCHGSARPSLPALAGTAGAWRARAGCWHSCPRHRGAAGGPAQQGSPRHSRVTPYHGSRDAVPGWDRGPRQRCRAPGNTAASTPWGCQSLLLPGTRGVPRGRQPRNPARGARGTPTPRVAGGPGAIPPSQPPGTHPGVTPHAAASVLRPGLGLRLPPAPRLPAPGVPRHPQDPWSPALPWDPRPCPTGHRDPPPPCSLQHPRLPPRWDLRPWAPPRPAAPAPRGSTAPAPPRHRVPAPPAPVAPSPPGPTAPRPTGTRSAGHPWTRGSLSH